MNINLDISTKSTAKVADVLNRLLADEYILLTKTRNYHWYVFGPSFMDRQCFYDGQYEPISQMVDKIADRVTQLGYPATATVREFIAWTRLDEGKHIYDAPSQVNQLLADHQTVSRCIREDIEVLRKKLKVADPETITMLTHFLEEHEKMAWMLRASMLTNAAA